MNNSEYHQLIDQLFLQLAEKIDNYQGNNDIDYELEGGIFTLTLNNQHKIVINRQEPLQQLWLASKTAGYHFNYQQGQWICQRSQQEFWSLLSQLCNEPFINQ